jgi:hypothetical protein
MIIKISGRKTDSSFHKLADYICRAKPGDEERIQSITTAGFEVEQPDWEVARNHIAEQHREKTKNSRKNPDNTLHVIVSFRPGEREKLDQDALEKIAQQVCSSIQLGDHKRIMAVHGDTQDPHMHLAVNLLDQRGRRRTPYKAFLALRDVREAIEKEHGFEAPSARAGKETGVSPKKPSDPNQKRETHSNQESFEGWLKKNIARALTEEINREGASWQSVQGFLSARGTTLRKQGAGLVFSSSSERVFCKASSIDRGFSLGKLQATLGEWEQVSVSTKVVSTAGFKSQFLQSKELYAEYQREGEIRKKGRLAAQNESKKAFKSARDSVATEIRTKKEKVMEKEADPRKRIAKLKALTFERAQLMEAVREDNQNRSKSVSDDFRHKTWLQFLQDKSQTGDMGALRALQSRNDINTTHPGNQVFTPNSWEPVGNTLRGLKAKIRSNGDIAYQLPSGRKEEIIDKGRRLLVGDKFSDAMLDASLKLAVAKFGTTLHLQGSDEFKRAIMQRAQDTKLKVSFAERARTFNTNQNGR